MTQNKLGLSCAKLSTAYASYPLAGSQLDWSKLSNSWDLASYWLGASFMTCS